MSNCVVGKSWTFALSPLYSSISPKAAIPGTRFCAGRVKYSLSAFWKEKVVKLNQVAPLGSALFLAISLAGCATAIEGTTQDIAVITIPEGAACVLAREGQQIGAISATPGSSHIEKSKYDITITCKKEGFEDAVVVDESDN